MSATVTPLRAADDPEVRAALDRVSAVIQRALLRIEQNRMRAAGGSPPAAQKEAAGAPIPAAAPLTSTTMTTAQHSDLGGDHVG